MLNLDNHEIFTKCCQFLSTSLYIIINVSLYFKGQLHSDMSEQSQIQLAKRLDAGARDSHFARTHEELTNYVNLAANIGSENEKNSDDHCDPGKILLYKILKIRF